MSSVTEAPRWRHEDRVQRWEPRFVSKRLGRLDLISANASQILSSGRRPALAPILVSPLLLALGALPWFAPRAPNALQVGTSAAFGVAAGCLAAWSWPRRQSMRVVSGDAAPPGALAVQPGTVRWVLDLSRPQGVTPASYTAALRTGDGEEHTLLESTDPERLIRQLAEVLRHWPGPVECRWGLQEGAQPWNIEPLSAPHTVNREKARPVLRSHIASRPLRVCMTITTALVCADLVFLVVSAAAHLQHVHPLSVVLSIVFALYLVVFTLGLTSAAYRLTLGSSLHKERTMFGVTKVVGGVRLEGVRGVYAIGAPGADRWHVLVDAADGPLAVAVPRRDAQPLARELENALSLARAR